ncbi:hypothetical protein GTHT12_01390 [Geobacillus thermodenitrificans]|uniref:hypothetical protein n=1 Tax=Geobacillus thermodenitrificans TaxID=33940 RepID=UPI00017E4A5E|nr:hypothetical protein [Geobacillus thermodenitrificans]ARP42929.1 hypothetical protein GTHT12_01390 [Geobacillus thermodenitrificans]MEC5186865.1 hypothetical protein [Geobacillus thermodenitrificans]
MPNMQKNRKLAKRISDSAWGTIAQGSGIYSEMVGADGDPCRLHVFIELMVLVAAGIGRWR